MQDQTVDKPTAIVNVVVQVIVDAIIAATVDRWLGQL